MSDEARVQAEWVSALMDGELRDEEFAHAIDYLEGSASARQAWDTYHLVGEVLRTGKLGERAHEAALIDRLRIELASTAPDNGVTSQEKSGVDIVHPVHTPATNDAWWRRAVGLVSVAVVGVMVWQVALWVSPGSSPGTAPALAQLPVQQQTGAPSLLMASPEESAQVMLRDPQLDALLAAHRQRGGVTALQLPAGFLRNATFNEASR